MTKLATFIVDKRNLFFLLTIIMLIFSAFSRNWVEVESELAAYLPADSQTRQALDIMEEQFTTYGSAQSMAANISQAQAEELKEQIAGIKGVQGGSTTTPRTTTTTPRRCTPSPLTTMSRTRIA